MAEVNLPLSVEAERWVLGSLLRDGNRYLEAARILDDASDFAIEKHRKIFRAMGAIYEHSEPIDRLTVINELVRTGDLDKCDGVSYLISLDDGMPEGLNIAAYCKIVKEKARLRRIMAIGDALVTRAGQRDAVLDDLLRDTLDQLTSLQVIKPEGGVETTPEIIEAAGGVDAFLQPHLRGRGLSTGFYRFDAMTGGMRPGNLICLGARPSVGKTAMALNITEHVGLKLNKLVMFFSVEMSSESLLQRLVCSVARVDSQRFQLGYLNQEERLRLMNAVYLVRAAPIQISYNTALRLVDMNLHLRRIKSAGGDPALVVVDYLQLMSTGRKFDNRVQEVSYLSKGLKVMAGELQVPVLMLSQLSRAPEQRRGDHRPMLSDLRDSGSLEQDSDWVAFLFRPEMYDDDRPDLRGAAELILAKQRNGPTGTIDLVFQHQYTKFDNRAEDFRNKQEPMDFKGKAAGE